jgi:hypothetical protein
MNAQRGVFEAGLLDGMWSVNQHSEDAQQGPLAGRNDCPDACRSITDGRRYAEAPLVATCLVAHFMNRVSVSDTRGSNFALDEGVPDPYRLNSRRDLVRMTRTAPDVTDITIAMCRS